MRMADRRGSAVAAGVAGVTGAALSAAGATPLGVAAAGAIAVAGASEVMDPVTVSVVVALEISVMTAAATGIS